jgi:superfamily I DNA and RNA helicase
LLAVLASLDWDQPDDTVFDAAVSALQSISTIRRGRARNPEKPNSRGARLQALEQSIATLDALQSKAVIETVDDVQRIRGLAGSGKTIVLALKAAYLHAQHPKWDIAVTFNSRALKNHFERLITTFSIEQTGEEPDWEKLRILPAWGAPGGGRREGIYHEFCVANDIEYLDYRTAQARWQSQGAFEGVCRKALSEVDDPRGLYDAVLVDEAQDLPIEFLRICYWGLRNPKRLVYAYDELQNLSGGAGLPSALEIFGIGKSGKPLVSFDAGRVGSARRDIILEKCYRNSRPVLVTAHALGFGTYRVPERNERIGLVQMFDQPDLWTDIGYEITEGQLEDGHDVTLARTPETSPLFLEEHSPLSDLIQFKTFASDDAQATWIADEIQANLRIDELRYDDIVVINTNPLTSRTNFGAVRKALLDRNILSHLAGVDTDAEVFYKHDVDSITCTGIFRAKGNEAGMVYIINAEEAFSSTLSLARVRNRLFTAITRSKAWVRVVGVGLEMEALTTEFQRVVNADFSLQFRYPNERERTQLQIVHRDMTQDESSQLRRRQDQLAEIVTALRNGELFREDLDDELLTELKTLLGERE